MLISKEERGGQGKEGGKSNKKYNSSVKEHARAGSGYWDGVCVS